MLERASRLLHVADIMCLHSDALWPGGLSWILHVSLLVLGHLRRIDSIRICLWHQELLEVPAPDFQLAPSQIQRKISDSLCLLLIHDYFENHFSATLAQIQIFFKDLWRLQVRELLLVIPESIIIFKPSWELSDMVAEFEWLRKAWARRNGSRSPLWLLEPGVNIPHGPYRWKLIAKSSWIKDSSRWSRLARWLLGTKLLSEIPMIFMSRQLVHYANTTKSKNVSEVILLSSLSFLWWRLPHQEQILSPLVLNQFLSSRLGLLRPLSFTDFINNTHQF